MFSRWTTPILWPLNEYGRQRFGELERRITTITPKVMTQRLRQLVRADRACPTHARTRRYLRQDSAASRRGHAALVQWAMVLIMTRRIARRHK